jgi:hypothetical protein
MNAPDTLSERTRAARERANALRFLAIDAVNAAKSGHPGMPMGMADIAEVLWRKFLRHDPANARTGPTATASCCQQRPWLDAAVRGAAPDLATTCRWRS